MLEMLNRISKVALDNYFNELAKIYKRKSHGFDFEFVLVGGASILINYNFRDVTNDIDACFLNSSDIKEAIYKVSEKYNLSPNWINDDFKTTRSYSNKLSEFSTFYKTFQNILSIRTIKDEYLIAMKLKSGRIYKNDLSDIVGIINSIRESGTDVTFEMIDKAINDLYGNWSGISNDLKNALLDILKNNDLGTLYKSIIKKETDDKQKLIDFNNDNENVLNKANIDEILKMLGDK